MKKKSILIGLFLLTFVFLISGTLMTSRATFYKAGARTKLFSGNVTEYTLADYLKNDAPKSGTDAVSNSPWILTSDHEGEWRYAGKNPDNYIWFNNELWRIIGVMPDMEYCTGEYVYGGGGSECNSTATGKLVKIVRNEVFSEAFLYDGKQSGIGSSISNSGSNDWSDSQLMLMLNGTDYLYRGYGSTPVSLHGDYTKDQMVRDGNGKGFYKINGTYLFDDSIAIIYTKPSIASSSYTGTGSSDTTNIFATIKIPSAFKDKVATVAWNLYGGSDHNSASDHYTSERSGSVYTNPSLPEERPYYWYGKIGLMYPSDYGYATNGGSAVTRAACIAYDMSYWSSGNYKTDCVENDWIWYSTITDTLQHGTVGTAQWTMQPFASSGHTLFNISMSGILNTQTAFNAAATYVRPVLYLSADTKYYRGTGTYNDPYIIYPGPTSYWYDYTNCTEANPCTFPNYGGALSQSGEEYSTSYIGQDGHKYYTCATTTTVDSKEFCLSQPYTNYGLEGHTLGSNFTTTQQDSLCSALQNEGALAGFRSNKVVGGGCTKSADSVSIIFGGLGSYITCGINKNGTAFCVKNETVSGPTCFVNSQGQAYCTNN